MINKLIQLHTELFFFLHGIVGTSSIVDSLIYFVAETLDWYVIFAGVGFILLHTHIRRTNTPRILSIRSLAEGIYIVGGVLSAWAISYIMKLIFAAPRPFLYFADFVSLFPYGGYDSFPSGHATLFAALATSIYLYHKKVGVIFIFLAFTIGLSRTIAGVHFPIDIVVGWLLGSVVSILVIHILNKKKKHL